MYAAEDRSAAREAADRTRAHPAPPCLAVHETFDGEYVRVRLIGELDLSSAPVLEHRLRQLRTERQRVRLDLSGLEFVDCSSLQLLIHALENDADGWRFEADPAISPQMERLLKLANMQQLIRRPVDEPATAIPATGAEVHLDAHRL